MPNSACTATRCVVWGGRARHGHGKYLGEHRGSCADRGGHAGLGQGIMGLKGTRARIPVRAGTVAAVSGSGQGRANINRRPHGHFTSCGCRGCCNRSAGGGPTSNGAPSGTAARTGAMGTPTGLGGFDRRQTTPARAMQLTWAPWMRRWLRRGWVSVERRSRGHICPCERCVDIVGTVGWRGGVDRRLRRHSNSRGRQGCFNGSMGDGPASNGARASTVACMGSVDASLGL